VKRSAPRFAELATAPDELAPASLGLRNREEACSSSATSRPTASAAPTPPLTQRAARPEGRSFRFCRTDYQFAVAYRAAAAGRPSAGAKRATTRVADGRRRVVGCESRDDIATVAGGLWFNASPVIRDRAADVGGRQQRLCRRGSTGAGHCRGPAGWAAGRPRRQAVRKENHGAENGTIGGPIRADRRRDGGAPS
jgi:hypothetical protein